MRVKSRQFVFSTRTFIAWHNSFLHLKEVIHGKSTARPLLLMADELQEKWIMVHLHIGKARKLEID
jgi:hypothetical protein